MITALWIIVTLVFIVTVANAAVAFLLWVYCAGLTSVIKNHDADKQKHWSSKWEDNSDA